MDTQALLKTTNTGIVIYCNTIRKVDWLSKNLQEKDFPIAHVHGQMTQEHSYMNQSIQSTYHTLQLALQNQDSCNCERIFLRAINLGVYPIVIFH